MARPQVFGFSETTARRLAAGLNQSGTGSQARADPNLYATHIRLGKANGTITAGSSGTIELFVTADAPTGWTVDTAQTFEGWAFGTLIPDNAVVICFPVNGRWLCFEVCS